jgi:DNA-binding transcriptional ArsR family regulator
MARAPTTADAFNAVAEPQRRRILNLLAAGERSVNDVAAALRMRQPQASKHLAVLSAVGLATPRDAGRQRLYALNARGLKPIHDWVRGFERFWSESFDRLAEHLNEVQKKGKSK